MESAEIDLMEAKQPGSGEHQRSTRRKLTIVLLCNERCFKQQKVLLLSLFVVGKRSLDVHGLITESGEGVKVLGEVNHLTQIKPKAEKMRVSYCTKWFPALSLVGELSHQGSVQSKPNSRMDDGRQGERQTLKTRSPRPKNKVCGGQYNRRTP